MTLTPHLAQQCLEALEYHVAQTRPIDRTSAAISALREALASPPTAILARAVDLHEKAGMPWPEAEELALNEAGIDDAAVDELIGECGSMGLESLLTTPDDLRTFTRSVLVHQPLALASGEGDEARDAAISEVLAYADHLEQGDWNLRAPQELAAMVASALRSIAAMKGNGK